MMRLVCVRMMVLISVLLCFLLLLPTILGETKSANNVSNIINVSTTYCTVVNITDTNDKEKSLILYRSLRISDILQEIKLLYVCIPVYISPLPNSTYSNIDESYYQLLSDLGVIPIEISLFNNYYQSDNYLAIECGLKVADLVAGYSETIHTTGIVYIDKKYFVTRSLSYYINSLILNIDSNSNSNSNPNGNNVDVACRNLDASTIISRKKSIESLDRIPFGPCDFDLFVISSRIGTALYSYVNSSIGMNMDTDGLISPYNHDYWSYTAMEWGRYHNSIDTYIQRFYLGVATLTTHSLRFLSQSEVPIVFANRHWSNEDPYLIEFDNVNHMLTINNIECTLNCFVQWKQFFTVDVIGSTMNQLLLNNNQRDVDVYNILVGCKNPNVILSPDLNINEIKIDKYQYKNKVITSVTTTTDTTTDTTDTTDETSARIKIFDGIIFSDEISMLLLRMEYLYDVVDYHIIIESKISFSGRNKSLIYQENSHLFEKYKNKIIHLILDQLAFIPEMLDQVWLNEYYSRNSLTYAMNHTTIHANDNDILLVSDTDEIPHPNALRNIRLYQQKPNNFHGTNKIYKFNMKNYLYNFNCYDYKQFNKFTPLTGASIGTAKRLCGYNKQFEFVNNVNFNYPTCMRLYLQHENPLPFEIVLSPGGWHLSFFSNIERIKNKLQNYGHQQFLEQFNADKIHIDLNTTTIDSISKAKFMKFDDFITLDSINRNISTDLLNHRISNGLHINYNNIEYQCISEHDYQLDQYDRNIREMWFNISTDMDRI